MEAVEEKVDKAAKEVVLVERAAGLKEEKAAGDQVEEKWVQVLIWVVEWAAKEEVEAVVAAVIHHPSVDRVKEEHH